MGRGSVLAAAFNFFFMLSSISHRFAVPAS